jgi:hypothetical protein
MAAVALQIASPDVELAPFVPVRPTGPTLYAVPPAEALPANPKPQYRWEISPADGRLVRVWK